jgi:hypothetical protein
VTGLNTNSWGISLVDKLVLVQVWKNGDKLNSIAKNNAVRNSFRYNWNGMVAANGKVCSTWCYLSNLVFMGIVIQIWRCNFKRDLKRKKKLQNNKQRKNRISLKIERIEVNSC